MPNPYIQVMLTYLRHPFGVLIEDKDVIKKILKHLGLWERKARPPPKAELPAKTFEFSIDYSSSQVLPDSDKWLYVDLEYPDNFSV